MNALLLALLLAGAADDAVLNRFNDPFEAVSSDIGDCPEPRGPRVTAAEARVQAHHRAERGTTCWLQGECSEPNAFRYDAGIAAALRERLRGAAATKPSSLWFTVQGRVVYLEGCVERTGQGAELEALARGLPNVQQALALVRVGRQGALPYRRLD
ncbi:BON domain-containing protein [Roseateles sp. NT4]|uniref:BON domain-containing protein n=1 Tax=Roseateles sp. NT4 TaxID=3453715 RepID=UPI003EE8D9DC